MAMTDDEFDALVHRLEAQSRQRPGVYKAKVLALGALGYAYVLAIVGVLVLLLGLLGLLAATGKGALLAKKLALPLIALAALIGRALWVRLPAPAGLPLKRRDYPRLFETLQDLRRRLRGPRIHQVLLTDDFNAAVAQVSRLGLFGWQKNYLVLGMPLMQALTPAQLTAVLAHEYGHLSGAHGRAGAWIYRLRKRWHQLMQALDREEHWGRFVFARFFDWYAPFFAAYSFVLARANEYEADRAAAVATGAREIADALIAAHIKAGFLDERYWPNLYAQADRLPQPVMSPFLDMGRLMRRDIDTDDAQRRLTEGLQEQTGTAETHPALKDRLAALEQEPRLPPPVTQTAAEHFFGARLLRLTEQLAEDWRARIRDSWKERYAQVQTSTQRLAALETARKAAPWSEAETYEYARLCEQFRTLVDPIPLYRAVLVLRPDHVSAHYHLGRLLLGRGDDAGIAHLVQAMDADEEAVAAGCRLVYRYLAERGREAEAEPYRQRYRTQIEREEERAAERDTLHLDDELVGHGLPAESLRALAAQLRDYRRIARAYLAQKRLHHSTKPIYVLGVVLAWWAHDDDYNQRLVKKLVDEVSFPGETFVVVLDGGKKRLKQAVESLPDALVYRRAARRPRRVSYVQG